MIVVWVAIVVVVGCLMGGVSVGVLMLAAQRTAGDTAVKLAVEARRMATGDGLEVPAQVASRRMDRRVLPAGRRNRIYED